jgi:TBC1 domain family protein 5
VQRLPEEANYHEERVQTMILDILFAYCKTYPNRGGYRQGMHELLAPIVHVVEHDAISRDAAGGDPSVDPSMVEMLDAAYIEHDAYTLFSQLMEHAQAFYQIKDSDSSPQALQQSTRGQEQSSAIVDRSKFIHEVCLQKVDPELAAHLTAIEVLPQIFIM